MYGTEGTNSRGRGNSSFVLDGSTYHLYQEPMALGTSDGLLYVSPLLKDAQHILVIQNLVAGGGEVLSIVQWGP